MKIKKKKIEKLIKKYVDLMTAYENLEYNGEYKTKEDRQHIIDAYGTLREVIKDLNEIMRGENG